MSREAWADLVLLAIAGVMLAGILGAWFDLIP